MMITPFYASLLTILFVVLSFRTIRLRRRLKIAVGDGGNPLLLRAMRAHANFAEYVPFALILIYFVETLGTTTTLVHLLGTCLLIGRLIHAFGVCRENETYRHRVLGMTLTISVLMTSSAYLLFEAITSGIGF